MRADWPTKLRSLGFKEFVSKSFDRVATSRISDSFLSLGFSFQFLVKKNQETVRETKSVKHSCKH